MPIAYAAEIKELTNIKSEILNPIITLLFAIAVLYFMWGVVKFIWNGGKDAAKEEGKSQMLWGIVGLTIMLSVYGLIKMIIATITELTGIS